MLRRDWGDKTEVWEGEERLGEGQEEVRGQKGLSCQEVVPLKGPAVPY